MPVTVTVTLPATANAHDRLEVPEPPVTVDGVRVQADGLSLTSATSPANPFNGPIVMIEIPATPTVVVTEVGLAEMVKSGAGLTVYVTVVE